MARVRAKIIAIGRVQGVFYRKTAVTEAKQLGLFGYARNIIDGSVEMVAEGDKLQIDKFIEWAHMGPSHAHVEDVKVHWEEPTGEFTEFRVRHV
jgi:acylphosphatase